LREKRAIIGIDDCANRPHLDGRSNFFAGETGACAGAEGETAPETLRPKDRDEALTLESGEAR